MIKKEIYPGVIVYKNLFNDINYTLDIVKKSIFQDSDIHIKKWYEWEPYGVMSSSNFNIINNKVDSLEANNQYKILSEISYLHKKVAIDYLKDKQHSNIIPAYINNFDLNDDRWINSDLSILKHIFSNNNLNLESRNKNMQMDYHTDEYIFNAESRGDKFILTINFYLNDDYTGGEISFVNDNDEIINIIDYRPEAGDVIVYPSFSPYFHGVIPIQSGNKYLIRTFLKWKYEGSDEWIKNEIFYGKDPWKEIQNNLEQSEYNKGKTWRHFIREGQIDDVGDRPYTKHIINGNIKYLDGRSINE